MDQGICIKFYFKKRIKCSTVFEMLTAAFGEFVRHEFMSNIDVSKGAVKMLKMTTALDALAHQQQCKHRKSKEIIIKIAKSLSEK